MLEVSWLMSAYEARNSAKLQKKLEELQREFLVMETQSRTMEQEHEMLLLKAENARLRSDKQSAARYEIEAMSFVLELKNLEQQKIKLRKRITKAAKKLEAMGSCWSSPPNITL